MKKNILKTILCIMCLANVGCTKDNILNSSLEDIDVVIIAGQSNAVGCSFWSYLNKDELDMYRRGFSTTKIRFSCDEGSNNSKIFTNVKTGQGHSTMAFGPELGMAKYFDDNQESINKTTYIIKYAVGGTMLYDRWRSPSSEDAVNGTGDLYTKFIDYCHESIGILSKKGFNPIVRAICWMQGESDAGINANRYKELEGNFINDVCDELSKYNDEHTINFIDAAISESPAWVNYKVINQAKKENCELDAENRYYIDTIKEGLTYDLEPKDNPDIYHYDAESMIKLGTLFAQVLIENTIIY